ncbi:MAG: peroxidase family protein [Candidatus Sumerlaeia bacterium]|nr:peroxidase family protein [Candidatus Sumerlaeia bacterium]
MKHLRTLPTLLAAAALAGLSPAQQSAPDRTGGETTAAIGDSVRDSARPRPPRRPPLTAALARLAEFRTITGQGNNPTHPEWGAAETPFLRLADAAYEDGTDAPSGADRPGAREVSNAICAQSESIENRMRASDYLWQWGQFIDHDVTETPLASPTEAFPVPVPAGDPWFDPSGTGTATIALSRSHYERDEAGARQQVNFLTAFVDASHVYGSDDARALALRTLDGTGKLKTSEGGLLPYNTEGFPNAPSGQIPTFFFAGDVRVNEQIGLTAMHTLFVREHNWWAERIAREHAMANPGAEPLDDETIYQRARAVVAGEMQAVTYNEFLPALLGPRALAPWRGYREDLEPMVANEFAAAAFRVGHTMLSPDLQRKGPDGADAPEGPIALADSFFAIAEIEEHGIDSILRGLASQRCQEIDNFIVGDVRNFLFGAPGAGGFDLASLNLQRGRDHGLPSYNEVRRQVGLRPARGWRDVTRNPALRAALASVYDSPEQADLWVTALCEDHVPGAMVGETLFFLITEQFEALRDGDRFWYQSYLPREVAAEVNRTRLSDIIRRNTSIGRELPADVFHVARRPNGPG